MGIVFQDSCICRLRLLDSLTSRDDDNHALQISRVLDSRSSSDAQCHYENSFGGPAYNLTAGFEIATQFPTSHRSTNTAKIIAR